MSIIFIGTGYSKEKRRVAARLNYVLSAQGRAEFSSVLSKQAANVKSFYNLLQILSNKALPTLT